MRFGGLIGFHAGFGGFSGASDDHGRSGAFLCTRRWKRNEPPFSSVRSSHKPHLSTPETLFQHPCGKRQRPARKTAGPSTPDGFLVLLPIAQFA
jgi:hypothetical protein